MDGGFFFVILIIGIMVFAFSVMQSKQADTAWEEAARNLGLMMQSSGVMSQRQMQGRVDGCFVSVSTVTRGGGKNSRTYTRYEVRHPRQLKLGLSIKRQGFLGDIAKAFGSQDIHVDDPAFDSLVIIKGHDVSKVSDFLSEGRRRLIGRLISQFESLEVHDEGFGMEIKGRDSSPQLIIRRVRQLVEGARGLASEEAEEKLARPPRLEVSKVPDLGIPQEPKELEPKTKPKPPPLPDRMGAVKDIDESAPSPPPVKTEEEEKVEDDQFNGFEIAEVARDLFGSAKNSVEAKKVFSEEFEGKPVRGGGLLRHWRATTFDFVFGKGSSILATIEIEGAGKNRSFEIIVRLPKDTPAVTKGEELFFEGRLFKVEPLVRRIFVDSL